MKIAIYSRGIENNQQKDIQLLLDELAAHNIEPVFFQDFFGSASLRGLPYLAAWS